MKSLKSLKFVFVLIAIFSLSACELIEEPNFDETTGTGEVTQEDYSRE